jgi:uncharacterized protein
MMRKTRLFFFALFTLTLTTACEEAGIDGASQPRQPNQITIGSNPAGSNVYAVAAGLAKVLQEQGGLRATIRPFSGSSVYLPLLQRGEITLGLNTSIDSYLTYHGLPPYTSRMDNLRALGVMFALPIMYMAPADSGLERIEDLRGKRVVITYRAMAALEQLHEAILATGGLTEDDVQSVIVAGLPEATRMLTEGRADAIPIGIGTALGLQVHSAVPGGVRFLTMGQDEGKLAEGMPGSHVATLMPEQISVGADGPVKVANVVDYLNASTHMPEDTAYNVIKTIHENWEALRREYAQMRSMPADAIAPSDNFHPYHPGAVRYYKEIGLWTEAHERNQERLLAIE